MRTIYPKLITTLFFILLAALIARYSGAPESGHPHHPATQQLGYNPAR
ncbi:MAG: hypothetical protein JSS76_08665 [Bacteroidetes bacterium]|nr:hypothetical protein [Bacteroidota bacterium]